MLSRRSTAHDDDPLTTDLLRVRAAAGVGLPELHQLPDRVRRAVEVAGEVGAPLVDALDGALAAQEDARRARRAVAVASAQTRAVAVGLLAAPALLVPGLGALVGADLGTFYRSPVGAVVLAIGLTLLALGALVIVVLVRRVGRARPTAGRRPGVTAGALLAAGLVWWRLGPVAAPLVGALVHALLSRYGRQATTEVDVDEAAELTAVAIAGGVGPTEALRVAAGALPRGGFELHQLAFDLEFGSADDLPRTRAAGADELARLREVIAAAMHLGAPAGPTLRRLAADLRADDLTRVLAAAERLPAHLTFPTALCLLPATVLLIGAPIVHAGLAAAGT